MFISFFQSAIPKPTLCSIAAARHRPNFLSGSENEKEKEKGKGEKERQEGNSRRKTLG